MKGLYRHIRKPVSYCVEKGLNNLDNQNSLVRAHRLTGFLLRSPEVLVLLQA